MQKNASLLDIVAVHTAENEASKVGHGALEQRSQSFNDQAVAAVTTFPAVGSAGAAAAADSRGDAGCNFR